MLCKINPASNSWPRNYPHLLTTPAHSRTNEWSVHVNICKSSQSKNTSSKKSKLFSCDLHNFIWLVVYLPLWKICSSVGIMTFPFYSKAPTRSSHYIPSIFQLYSNYIPIIFPLYSHDLWIHTMIQVFSSLHGRTGARIPPIGKKFHWDSLGGIRNI